MPMGHGTDPEHFALHPAHVISGSGDHIPRREGTVMTGRSTLITLNNDADIERIRPEEINRAIEPGDEQGRALPLRHRHGFAQGVTIGEESTMNDCLNFNGKVALVTGA